MKFWTLSDRDTDPEARRVRAGAVALAVGLHVGLGVLVMSYSPERAYQDDMPVLSVDLVTLPPQPEPEPEPIVDPIIEPQPELIIQPEAEIQPDPDVAPESEPKPELEPELEPEPVTKPNIPSAPPPIAVEPQPVPSILQNEALSEPGGLSAPANPLAAGDKNAADDARIDQAMAGLGRDLKCLRSTDPNCRKTRDYMLEEYRLTETQKVWTSNRSDTGMPSAYYGLSEREIMKKLNVAVAGENDMVIPFTNIGLMGSWADALHGAKGKCDFIVGGNSKSASPEDEIGGFNYGATGRAFARNCDISNERPSSTGPAWGN